MSEKRENIRINNADSIILTLILLVIIICHNTNINSSDRNRNPSATEISVNQSIGTFCSGLRIQVFQKIWISNKDIFKLLSINNIQFLDNKKADQLIALLQTFRNRTEKIQTSFYLYHLFPTERDEVPILS